MEKRTFNYKTRAVGYLMHELSANQLVVRSLPVAAGLVAYGLVRKAIHNWQEDRVENFEPQPTAPPIQHIEVEGE